MILEVNFGNNMYKRKEYIMEDSATVKIKGKYKLRKTQHSLHLSSFSIVLQFS